MDMLFIAFYFYFCVSACGKSVEREKESACTSTNGCECEQVAEHHKSIQATQTPEARVTLGEQERGKLVLASAAGASQSDRLMRKVEEGARQYRAICAQRGTTYDT